MHQIPLQCMHASPVLLSIHRPYIYINQVVSTPSIACYHRYIDRQHYHIHKNSKSSDTHLPLSLDCCLFHLWPSCSVLVVLLLFMSQSPRWTSTYSRLSIMLDNRSEATWMSSPPIRFVSTSLLVLSTNGLYVVVVITFNDHYHIHGVVMITWWMDGWMDGTSPMDLHHIELWWQLILCSRSIMYNVSSVWTLPYSQKR